jgi:hypothetical protein
MLPTQITLQNKMSSRSKRVGIFEGPDSDLERTKPPNAKSRGRSTRGKQTTPLKHTKTKSHYNTRSRGIGEKTQPGQKVLSGREQKQSALKKSKSGKRDKPRRSARLEAQRSKDAIST